MDIPVKGKKEWTRSEWIEWRHKAEAFNALIINRAKIERACAEASERED